MSHVDTLSRCYPTPKAEEAAKETALDKFESTYEIEKCRTICAIDEDELSFQIQLTQNRDEDTLRIRDKLEQGPVANFELMNGLVFQRADDTIARLYVHREMENNVIRLIHEKIGHMAIDKTYEKMHRHYWFPEMRKKIGSFIRNCIRCIIYAAPVRTAERRLYCIKKEPVPFDTIHMDHFGPLPAITSKGKHILAITDGFSKHNKLYSVLSTSTKEVLRCMEKYFDYFGRPRRVITDQADRVVRMDEL